MIYVSKKLKYMFDLVPVAMMDEEGIVNLLSASEDENSVKVSKIIYAREHEDEVKDIPYDDWDIININGCVHDLRSDNLELVVFKE